MQIPALVYLYRITHIENLRHILKKGLVTDSSPDAILNFKRIGDSSLINYRKDLLAPDPPGGYFKDYIPFYFGPRSPMLYQIATGWEGIEKFPQEDIIYIITTVDEIRAKKLEFFFSDGHARSHTSNKYTNINDLNKLDWEVIYSNYWKNDTDDLRRKEKKQAEFLVKNHVPVECIVKIGVYKQEVLNKIIPVLNEEKMELTTFVCKEFYYDFL